LVCPIMFSRHLLFRLHHGRHLLVRLPATAATPSDHHRQFSSLNCQTRTRSRALLVLPAVGLNSPNNVSFSRSFSSEAWSASLHAFYLGCMKSYPTTLVMEQLCAYHDTMDLHWWAVIATATVALRLLLMFPAHVTAQKVFPLTPASKKLLHAAGRCRH
jgi:hypothetical protein